VAVYAGWPIFSEDEGGEMKSRFILADCPKKLFAGESELGTLRMEIDTLAPASEW